MLNCCLQEGGELAPVDLGPARAMRAAVAERVMFGAGHVVLT
jgi:hypothetical protein